MTTGVELREGQGGFGTSGCPSFCLDKVNQCGWLGAEPISVSPKAFSVLLYLAERPGRLVTKEELLDHVWPDVHVTEGVLKRAVLEIRKALSDSAEEPRFIQTLHRRGYRFLAQNTDESGLDKTAPVENRTTSRREGTSEQPLERRPLNLFHIFVGEAPAAWRDGSRSQESVLSRQRRAAGLRVRPAGFRPDRAKHARSSHCRARSV